MTNDDLLARVQALRAEVATWRQVLTERSTTEAGAQVIGKPDAPLYRAALFEDAAGSEPYRGRGAERRERLAPPPS